MRVLLTLDFPPEHGGIQRYLHDIVRFLYREGDRVVVASRHGRDGADEHLRATVKRLVPPTIGSSNVAGIVLLAIVLLRMRSREPEPIVECGNVYAGVAGLIVRVLRGRPYRVYAYGTELLGLDRHSPACFLLRTVLRKAEKLIVLGEYTRGLVTRLGVTALIEIRPPKIVLSDVAVYEQEDDSGKQSRPTLHILSVGRMVPHKGHEVLLDAARRLPSDIDWRLTIVGDGPRKKSLQRACAVHRLADRVRFLSGLSSDEVSREYANADVFVLPSLTTAHGVEGFGIVMLEAMAHGDPVVASNTGGIPEVLDNGRCGLLVPPGDPAKLAEALVRVYNDGSLRKTLVHEANARLRERYVWNA